MSKRRGGGSTFSFAMTPAARKRAELLKEATQAPSMSRVINDALDLYTLAYKAKRNGEVLAIMRFDKDGAIISAGRVVHSGLANIEPEGGE